MMLNLVKNYIKSIKVSPIRSLISVYGSSNINSYSSNHFLKYLARNYIKDNLLNWRPLSVQWISKENKNDSQKYYNSFQSQLWYHKSLTLYAGKSKILNEKMTHSECSAFQSCSRYYSTENNEKTPEVNQRMLMDFPLIVWPSFLNTIRVWFMVYLIIKPFYEAEFSMKEFCIASKQALVKVSNMLSEGDLSRLNNFIDENALKEIQKNFSVLSVKERLDLAVNVDDIFFYFPYQIGLIFNNDGNSKDRVFLEITMCFHIFRGFKEYIEKSVNPNMNSFYDKDDRVSIANYRFVREITRGTDDEWNINIVNHFKPIKLATRY